MGKFSFPLVGLAITVFLCNFFPDFVSFKESLGVGGPRIFLLLTEESSTVILEASRVLGEA